MIENKKRREETMERRLETHERIETHEKHYDRDQNYGNGRTLTELVKDLRDESTLLLKQEIALAKTEMMEKASKTTRNIAYLAVGASVAFVGFLFLVVALNNGLTAGLMAANVDYTIAIWVAPLILGIVIGLIGYAFVHKSIHTLSHMSYTPEKTKDTLNEDKEWAKEKIRH
jgi:anti-sigma factor RsiW